MNNITISLPILLLAGVLWVTGAVLHWYTIRRQERLVARLRRLSVLRVPGPAVAPEGPDELPAEYLRPSKRWTVG